MNGVTMMTITFNILYSSSGDNAKKFAEEMVSTGLVERVRAEPGNKRYEYFLAMDDTDSVLLIDQWDSQEAITAHHKSQLMEEITKLRDQYQLRMKVTHFIELD